MTLPDATPAPSAPARAPEQVIDGDIHNTLHDDKLLHPYLPQRWRRHMERLGRIYYYPGGYYPRVHQNAARADAWPPDPGKIPGSDLDFMRRQLLDEWGLAYGILNPLILPGDQSNSAYAAALATAVNDWLLEHWLEPEPRLRSCMAVPYEDGDLAATEVERRADDPRFVQILLPVRTREPLGRRKYWPLFEAAVRHRRPIAIHFGGASGWPLTGAGWPSFYFEDHCGMAQSFQSLVISLVLEGVFEQFPTLKIVLVEGGFAWLAPLMWRLDRAWKLLGEEVPQLQRAPSEYIRAHFWFTTQPMEEPPVPQHFHQLLDQLAMNDHILFATDYPHWDFDAPDLALPNGLSPELRRRIMSENARALYGLP